MLLRLTIAACLLAASSAHAVLPEQCIQDPARQLECPRIIYKSAMMPNEGDEGRTSQIVCVCLTDFQDILLSSDAEAKELAKNQRFRSIGVTWGLSTDELLDIIRYD